MAQLVKLRDYISRYEWNPFHYPSQYIRLKQENWKSLNDLWDFENEKELEVVEETSEPEQGSKWNPFAKKESSKVDDGAFIRSLPKSKKDLTQFFLDELFPFQLKWATSTISEVSYSKQQFNYDETLKYFLQRFPDIYLLMYYPIFNINNKVPIDGEIIMISPIGIDIIVLMEKSPSTTIIVSDERTWTIEDGNDVSKIISPLISLKRSEQIVKSILQSHKIDIAINKTVLSRTNNILFSTEPYNTSIVGKNEYEQWFSKKRNLSSPLKSVQLKAMEALLHHCLTTSTRRPEWEADEEKSFDLSSYEEE